jgi:predicted nuclease of predicted toxin-antitoxin system
VILLADENIDKSLVTRLREDGHEVLAVAEMKPGIEDDVVLTLANERKALLVTEDKDFGELVFRQGLVHAGVILVRLAGLPVVAKGERLSRTLADHGGEIMEAFTVLSRGALRIRHRTL